MAADIIDYYRRLGSEDYYEQPYRPPSDLLLAKAYIQGWKLAEGTEGSARA
jgi:hypothetical protein